MLVLTREVGESIWIGDVRVLVARIHNGYVRLAIDAPKGVPADREEIRKSKNKTTTEPCPA